MTVQSSPAIHLDVGSLRTFSKDVLITVEKILPITVKV